MYASDEQQMAYVLAQEEYRLLHPIMDDSANGQLLWLDECVWSCSEKLGLVEKTPKPLDRDKWGWCQWTDRQMGSLSEDMVWLEKGKMLRGMWWDATCAAAQKEARKAEREYRRGHARLLDNIQRGIGRPMSVEETHAAVQSDNMRKAKLVTSMKAAREVMRRNEKGCRLRKPQKMLEDGMNRKFWRQVASIDIDQLQARMKGQGNDGSTATVLLSEFAAHFDKIAQPPACEYFDHAFMQQILIMRTHCC